MPSDPYRVLGLGPAATPAEVKRAYRALAKANHPDSAGEVALAHFLAIQAAYEQLANAKGRPTGRPRAGAREAAPLAVQRPPPVAPVDAPRRRRRSDPRPMARPMPPTTPRGMVRPGTDRRAGSTGRSIPANTPIRASTDRSTRRARQRVRRGPGPGQGLQRLGRLGPHAVPRRRAPPARLPGTPLPLAPRPQAPRPPETLEPAEPTEPPLMLVPRPQNLPSRSRRHRSDSAQLSPVSTLIRSVERCSRSWPGRHSGSPRPR
jgi:hypothetical protein